VCSGEGDSKLLCVHPLVHNCHLLGPVRVRTLTDALQTHLVQSSQRYHPISHLKKAVMREFQNVSKVSRRAGFKLYLNDTSQWPQSPCCPSLGLTTLPC